MPRAVQRSLRVQYSFLFRTYTAPRCCFLPRQRPRSLVVRDTAFLFPESGSFFSTGTFPFPVSTSSPMCAGVPPVKRRKIALLCIVFTNVYSWSISSQKGNNMLQIGPMFSGYNGEMLFRTHQRIGVYARNIRKLFKIRTAREPKASPQAPKSPFSLRIPIRFQGLQPHSTVHQLIFKVSTGLRKGRGESV